MSELFTGKILPVNLEHEMKFSYIDYAMSVIVSRAIPDVRDGLKPVHRRILYAMQEAGMTSTKPYKKSARIVGEVLGKYHPHGDTSVYDAIVRMAQDFSMRYTLADGHGNFGSVDGDPAAAMRYTEVRMSKISELMLQDIDKETVDFVPNYDESLKEPSVLPSKFPQLLVNGTSGIAVGMATNIPPHNMGEVIDATLLLIDNPEAELGDLMEKIQGPDFPTAAQILGNEGIVDAYRTGRGLIKMRAKTEIDTLPNGKPRIIVTELPYQVNKARLIEKIADLARDKTIEGITDLRDESDREGMRIVMELRKDINPQIILNQLFKHTQMQDSFGVIMLALVNGKPEVLTLKQVLQHYIRHQEEIVTRRTNFELEKAKARAHILEGLNTAIDNLDAVIKIVRESETVGEAKNQLTEKFGLSDIQAQAILDLRLQKLTGLEREKIETELRFVKAAIEKFNEILGDENKILEIIKSELLAVKEKFNDERRTEIIREEVQLKFDEEDLIHDDDIVVTLTRGGYVKRIALSTYKNQKRGGIGVTGMSTKAEDIVEHILITTNHHTILFFTNRGRVFPLKAYQIVESSRVAKGVHIGNLIPVEGDELVTALIKVKDFDPTRYLFMATKKGLVKKTQLSEFNATAKRGVIAIKLQKGDELIGVKFTEGERYVILGTAKGKAIVFAEEEVRALSRATQGVRGIKLSKGDYVVGMDKLSDDAELLTVSAEGYGKRTPTSEYRPQARGGVGIINMKVTEKTGDVIGIKVVRPDRDLLLITTEGLVIRTNVSDISVISRNTQGVMLMKTKPDDKVAALATVVSKTDEG
ncbi:MAG: DNA gyrase subunit A [Selenomonadaceae bacterium]|nr:DNA gyrase subunit A [Selenomonadaceae bacterium]